MAASVSGDGNATQQAHLTVLFEASASDDPSIDFGHEKPRQLLSCAVDRKAVLPEECQDSGPVPCPGLPDLRKIRALAEHARAVLALEP